MSCGLPCVCAAVGGAKEILLDADNCLLVEAGNIQQMAQAIVRVLADERLRKDLSQRALQMIENCFAIDLFAQRCEKVLRACVIN
jgi:spore coat protein SA